MRTCKQVLEQLMAASIEDDEEVLREWVKEILDEAAESATVEGSGKYSNQSPTWNVDKKSITNVINEL